MAKVPTAAELAIIAPLCRKAMLATPSYTGTALEYRASKWISIKQGNWIKRDNTGEPGKWNSFSGRIVVDGQPFDWNLYTSPVNHACTMSVKAWIFNPSDILCDDEKPTLMFVVTGEESLVLSKVIPQAFSDFDLRADRYMTPATMAPGVNPASDEAHSAMRAAIGAKPEAIVTWSDGFIVRTKIVDVPKVNA